MPNNINEIKPSIRLVDDIGNFLAGKYMDNNPIHAEDIAVFLEKKFTDFYGSGSQMLKNIHGIVETISNIEAYNLNILKIERLHAQANASVQTNNTESGSHHFLMKDDDPIINDYAAIILPISEEIAKQKINTNPSDFAKAGHSIIKYINGSLTTLDFAEAFASDDRGEVFYAGIAYLGGAAAGLIFTALIPAAAPALLITALAGLASYVASELAADYAKSKGMSADFGMASGSTFSGGIYPPLAYLKALEDAGLIAGPDGTKKTPDKTGPSFDDAKKAASPIIIDLDGDGIETLSKNNGVFFDYDGDYLAERCGWVSSDDGLLVLDINKNGKIESGKELFGNNTSLINNVLASNGYQALQELDDDKNGVINNLDKVWNELSIWQDKNINGRVDEGELNRLERYEISEISVNYTKSSTIDVNNNAHRQIGDVTFSDGHKGASTDVWFDVNKGYTRYIGDIKVSDDIVALPYIREFGKLVNFHIAMTENAQLRRLIENFVSKPSEEALKQDINEIIFTWASVNDLNPNSKNDYLDPRKLAVIEKATGEIYTGQLGPQASHLISLEYDVFAKNISALLLVQTVYKDYFDDIKITLNDSLDGFTLDFMKFKENLLLLEKTDIFSYFELAKITRDLLIYSPYFSKENEEIVDMANHSIASTNLNENFTDNTQTINTYLFRKNHGQDTLTNLVSSDTDIITLRFTGAHAADVQLFSLGNDLIIRAYGSDDSVTLSGFLSNAGNRHVSFAFDDITLNEAGIAALPVTFIGTQANNTQSGWNGQDIMYGAAGNDMLIGGNGDDRLDGGADNDTLIGGIGDDRLDGGAGNDTLEGGNGADHYLFSAGHGHDVINDYASKAEDTDTLVFSGALSSDARIAKQGNDLVIYAYGNNDSVTVKNYFMSATYQYFSLAFEDTLLTQASLTLREITVAGTPENDSLFGWDYGDLVLGGDGNDSLSGNGGNDVLDGGADDDRLYGNSGNDQLDGGAGNDTLTGGEGQDRLTGGTGDDTLDGGSSGADLYMFHEGHGHDVLTDYSSNIDQTDRLVFSGARSTGMETERVGQDLVIYAYGNSDSVILKNYFIGSINYKRYELEFSDTTLTNEDLMTVTQTDTLIPARQSAALPSFDNTVSNHSTSLSAAISQNTSHFVAAESLAAATTQVTQLINAMAVFGAPQTTPPLITDQMRDYYQITTSSL
ncbi:calcium-binding protein [Rahnella sp. PAMC25617]|uniref:calcium-binding protein n=1 Tax=Rahnella sp. PAMC25617 TaxID=3399684 RepID=UPI003D36724D